MEDNKLVKSIYLFNLKSKEINKYSIDDAIFNLYYLKIRIPTTEEIKKELENRSSDAYNEYPFIKKNKVKFLIEETKNNLSLSSKYIILFDSSADNLFIYLINDIGTIMHKNRPMRNKFKKGIIKIPDNFIKRLMRKRMEDILSLNNYQSDVILRKKLRKFKIGLSFLNSFNLDELVKSYASELFHFPIELVKFPDPSFGSHSCIPTLFSYVNIINYSICSGKIKRFENFDYINDLYKNIFDKNISTYNLVESDKIYISSKDCADIVHFYSFTGSKIINNYLLSEYYSDILENYISKLDNLLIGRDRSNNKNFTELNLFRFTNIKAIDKLKVGEKISSNSFNSFSRFPFLNISTGNFGNKIIGINLSPDTNIYSYLFIELLSEFPDETEVLLSRNLTISLDKRRQDIILNDTSFYKYEFSVKHPAAKSKRNNKIKLAINEFDFKSDKFNSTKSISSYLNKLKQFCIDIDGKKRVVFYEKLLGTGVYKNHFKNRSENIIFLTCLNEDAKYLFTIEISQNNEMRLEIIVNYNLVFNSSKIDIVKSKDFHLFLSTICNLFLPSRCLIYPKYFYDNNGPGYYPLDVYEYLKDGKKRFEGYEEKYILPEFSFKKIDDLSYESSDVISNFDQIIHYIHRSYDFSYCDRVKNNINDLFLWMIDKKFSVHIKRMVDIVNFNYYNVYLMVYKFDNYLYSKSE